jgi:hypothetical protein
MNLKKIDPVLFLQVEAAHAFMHKHNLTPDEFLELDKKYDILNFLEIGYYPFHLTGTPGIVMEIEEYIEGRKNAENNTAKVSVSNTE